MKDKHRLRLRQSRALPKYKKCRKQVRSAQLAEESRVVNREVYLNTELEVEEELYLNTELKIKGKLNLNTKIFRACGLRAKHSVITASSHIAVTSLILAPAVEGVLDRSSTSQLQNLLILI
ncbi:hypothetical protein J6590_019587 [Homalodisca vitripennis]|nr:hypothetical protein J6590_019587 [Homalodisca vitripennis]